MCFAFEFLVKLLGFGTQFYFFASKYHKFDTFIVFASIIDVALTSFFYANSQGNRIVSTVMNATRIIRLFKLAKYWKGFKVIIETLWMTMANISSFTSLIVVVFFSYILLGQVLFMQNAKFDPRTGLVDFEKGTSPLLHFDDLINSFMSLFSILINDGQSAIYYNYYRAGSPVASTLYWVSFVILTSKILQNIFIAIIL